VGGYANCTIAILDNNKTTRIAAKGKSSHFICFNYPDISQHSIGKGRKIPALHFSAYLRKIRNRTFRSVISSNIKTGIPVIHSDIK